MKNKLIFLHSFIIALVFLFAFTTVSGQNPIAKIDFNATGLVPGSTVTVPISLTGDEIGNVQFIIWYDRDVLTYVSGLASGNFPTGAIPSWNANFTTTLGNYPNQPLIRFAIGGIGGAYAPGVTYPVNGNPNVLNLTFTYNGGMTDILFVNLSTTTANTATHFTFIKAKPYTTICLPPTATFTNGSASGDYATITSVAGGGNWGTAASWDLAKVPNRSNKVVINSNPATPLINEATHICTGGLTINTGKAMTNNFPLTVNGDMVLKSVDLTGSGSYIDNSTTTVTGTIKAERYMTGNWDGINWPTSTTIWHHISSPVTGCNASVFFGDLLCTFVENTPVPAWSYITDGFTPLSVGKGFSAATKSDGVITFYNGPLNTGDKTITLTNNGGVAPQTGYNLVGNPFPCALDWSLVTKPGGLDGSAYVWDGNLYQYKASPPNGNAPGTFDGKIPAEQGFFVHTTVNNSILTLPASARVHNVATYFKSGFSDLLTLKIDGNGYKDEALIYFDADATEGFDPQFDAYKLYGADAAPQLFSILPNDNLTINSLPSVSSNPVVAVGLKVGITETYTITASGMETFANGSDIYLVDLFLNKTQNLNNNPVYEFTASPGSDMHRFDVHFAPTTGIAQGTSNNIKIYAAEKSVYVNIPMTLHGEIIVYDLLGKEVKRQPIEGNMLNKVNLNVQLGYYLVKVLGDKSTVSGKVFIR